MSTLHDMLIAANAEISSVIEVLTRHSVTSPTITLNNQLYTTANAISKCYTLNSAVHSIAFSIRNMSIRAPYRLQHDTGFLLDLFETNHLIGWEASETVPTLQMIRSVAETLMGGPGVYVAFLTQIQKSIDMLYQTRMTFSLFYYHLDA